MVLAANVPTVSDGSDRRSLDDLYDELRRFAPDEAATELAALASRLKEIRESGASGEGDHLSAIWDRVEQFVDSHPRPDTR